MSKLITKAVKYNGTNESANGKYFLRVVHTERVTLKKLVKHIMEHGSPYDRGTVAGVAYQLVDCIKELVMESKKVELGDLGTFYIAIHSEGQTNRADCTSDTIGNAYLRFAPSRTLDQRLDSKSLRQQAEFVNLESSYVAAPDDTDTGDDTGGNGGSGSGSGDDDTENMPLNPQP